MWQYLFEFVKFRVVNKAYVIVKEYHFSHKREKANFSP